MRITESKTTYPVEFCLEEDWRSRKNQSRLHEELSFRALIWLANRATARGIMGSTEMWLKPGYSADAVAMGALQLKHEEMFLAPYFETGADYKRFRWNREHEANQTGGDDWIFIFETKVSRADFLKTFVKNNRGANRLESIGHFHFIVTPKDMVTKEEVPEFWGLLEASGRGMSLKRLPLFTEPNISAVEVGYLLLRYGNKWGNRTHDITHCPDCFKKLIKDK